MSDQPPPDDTRRAFLRTSTCMIVALAAAGVLPRELYALPRHWIVGTKDRRGLSYPIPVADGVSIDKQAQVILVRSQGRAMAFNLSCPHQNAAVRWFEKDHRFQCSKHDSVYSPTGAYTSGRATRNMDRFAVSRAGDSVVVDVDRLFHSDTDPAAWAAAFVAV
jgi:nitrite reductase/ring-hydroxylating ferredoxin subunit